MFEIEKWYWQFYHLRLLVWVFLGHLWFVLGVFLCANLFWCFLQIKTKFLFYFLWLYLFSFFLLPGNTDSTCVLESDFGFSLNCAFKKSSLFRVRNLGGLKAHFGLGNKLFGKFSSKIQHLNSISLLRIAFL